MCPSWPSSTTTATSTTSRRLAALGRVHSLAGHDNPCTDALVREAMHGVRRALGVVPRHQKRAVTTEEIAGAVDQEQDDADEVWLEYLLESASHDDLKAQSLLPLPPDDVLKRRIAVRTAITTFLRQSTGYTIRPRPASFSIRP